MRGLLIEFDGTTGRRPRGISPKDPGLKCWGWQQLDPEKVRELGYVPRAIPNCCLEIRVIEDDRDTSQYEGRESEGITLLRDDREIQEAIDKYVIPLYAVQNEVLFRAHLEQRGVRLDDVPGRNTQEQLKHLYSMGIKGIAEIRRPRLKEIYPQATTT